MNLEEVAQRTFESCFTLQSLDERTRINALNEISQALLTHQDLILRENQKDLKEAQTLNLSEAMIDRLKLSPHSLKKLAQSCLDISLQPSVLGEIVEEMKRDNGLIIRKERVPLGVIAMIFESRPNVIVDATCLAIKSGNAIILKGGKEAKWTNRILFQILSQAIENLLPLSMMALIEERADVAKLLKLHQYIHLVVPRGGHALVQFVKEHATMPVIAHDKGLCHLYLHEDYPFNKARDIILNAKTQRPGVCNALESLLVHRNFPHLKELIQVLLDQKIELRGCSISLTLHPEIKKATPEDYLTEYLDNILSLKIVTDADEAIAHIQHHGSHHTEAILAQDAQTIDRFLSRVDASAIMVNASTRFNDGGELGLGAELGISTSKLHVYGPMGAREMTAIRTVVLGDGQIRE